jgi:hypothetical protein
MKSILRDLLVLTGSMVAFGLVVLLVLFGIATACWGPASPASPRLQSTPRDASRAADEARTSVPTQSTPANPGNLAPLTDTPDLPAATSTPAPPQPTVVNPPSPPQAPLQTPAPLADFTGRWRITDTVTGGANAGESFTFDVSLVQQGATLTGGNDEIVLSGYVTGETAVIEYVQPALGYAGTFVWTKLGPNQAQGTFTNSYPNSGTSTITRLS